jgi:hypothetical protein
VSKIIHKKRKQDKKKGRKAVINNTDTQEDRQQNPLDEKEKKAIDSL